MRRKRLYKKLRKAGVHIIDLDVKSTRVEDDWWSDVKVVVTYTCNGMQSTITAKVPQDVVDVDAATDVALRAVLGRERAIQLLP